MKEKIEKLLKSHLKRKLTITTATLIAFLLSSNLAMGELLLEPKPIVALPIEPIVALPIEEPLYYEVGNVKIERNNSGTWENATEYLGKEKTALFEISETNIVNRLKKGSWFTLLEEVNKSFINEGSIEDLTNNGAGKIENRGFIWGLKYSATESEIENRGYIFNLTSVGNITNKGYIYSIGKANNIVNDGYISRLGKNKNITNNGIIGGVYNSTHIANNGIISLTDELYNTLKNNGKLENKGIITDVLSDFVASGNKDDKGRAINNYKETSITDTSIEKIILNAYRGKIENDLKVKNNSILNMYEGEIAANKKISIDNSTVNMRAIEYNDGLQLEFKNNSKIGVLDLRNLGNKIESLTMDNTTEVGSIEIGGDIGAINLVPSENIANINRVLRINELRTNHSENVNTNISTNVDLLGDSRLGNITVEKDGRLTIAKDALKENGVARYGGDVIELFKKDITIKKGGKIIIGIDPYNINSEISLGDGNNLTESVIGQVDTTDPKLRKPQSELNIDTDSLLHDIVILPKYSVAFVANEMPVEYVDEMPEMPVEYVERPKISIVIVDGTQEMSVEYKEIPKISRREISKVLVDVSNKYKVVEELNLPKSTSEPTDDTELNSVYQDLQKAGGVKYLKVGNDEQVFGLYEYLRDMYANSPYALSAETSFRNLAMLRDNAYLDLKPNLNKWAVMGGLSHSDRENKFKHKLGTTEADTITTGAYAKGEYGLKEDTTLGLILGGTNSKSDLLTGKVKGSSIYLGAYAKKYINNFKFTLGTGIDLGEYKVDRNAIGYAGIIETEKYSAKQKNRAFDLYAEARYSKDLGNNFYLEPNFNLAYSRVRQGGATENDGKINLDIKSKTFNQTTAALGLDLKKVLLNGNTSHSFALGTAYERVLSGAKENTLRASFVGGSGSGFDILVPEKEKGRTSIGAEYKLENKVGILFNLKMDYGFKHGSDKKDIRFSTGLGYRF